jgi:two-component system chemotaxis response regulator CheY
MATMRILIADDNQRMRRLLRTLLKSLLTECWEAENGLEAVEKYQAHHPDAVLMDIRMPVMDGLEATRRIVALDPNAIIVMVTDYDDPSYRTMSMMVGAWKYVIKDSLFDLHAMLGAIQRAME